MLFILVILATFAFLSWAFVCNERTYKQRIAIIKAITSMRDFDEFDKVSYHTHWYALIFFRDWRKLYSRMALEIR